MVLPLRAATKNSAASCMAILTAGRNRWVLFSDRDNMTGEDPSTVPPEWHGKLLLLLLSCFVHT